MGQHAKLNQPPILYTFRRCPYAMRARMTLAYSGINFELREVVLSNKPQQMLDVSPKGTVPILVTDSAVLDQSLDILHWALAINDPHGWKAGTQVQLKEMAILVQENDSSFKPNLDRYKYHDRHPQQSQSEHRAAGECFLLKLEGLLERRVREGVLSPHLFGENVCYADIAVMPFVRQFANVDAAWFEAAAYPQLRNWLHRHLSSVLFLSVMNKYPAWQATDPSTFFRST